MNDLKDISHEMQVMTTDTNRDDNDVSSKDETPIIYKKPLREVICMDSLVWLDTFDEFSEGDCIFTSLPDITELPTIFHGYLVKEYKEWFTNTVSKIMSKLKIGSYLILLQSDTRMMNTLREAYEWVDKSHLASVAADRNHCTMAWHKLVLFNNLMSKRSTGRPSYSHLVCYVKNPDTIYSYVSSDNLSRLDDAGKDMTSHRTSLFAIPDIFYRGEMLWAKGIGIDCCYVAVKFLVDIAKAKRIIDPFAGQGTVLAMANFLGVYSVGIEISPKRCRKASRLQMTEAHFSSIAPYLRSIALEKVKDRESLKKINRDNEEERYDSDDDDDDKNDDENS